MAKRPTPAALRERIALTLQAETKDYETEAICDRLGMPPGEWTHNSKRVYVQNRLAGVGLEDLLPIARRVVDEFGDAELEAQMAAGGVRGVVGELKNLIFAANGPKPRIVLRDAVNNVIEIVENAEYCLVFNRPLPPEGLRWEELLKWWTEREGEVPSPEAARDLYRRLASSLQSREEAALFRSYCARYGNPDGAQAPALVPQIYLHYDPYTRGELRAREGQELQRQRMDFLLLLPDRARVVIEVDGEQHYSEGGRPSPLRYAQMVREDRSVRVTGYEVYRFGASELRGDNRELLLTSFFDDLLTRHGVA